MKTKHHIILSTPVIQSGDQKLNNSIRRKWFALALGGFLFTSIFALSAHPVEAQCKQWDVSGKWRFNQDGGNFALLDLRQNGTVITGTAGHKPGAGDITSGTVDGTVERDSFAVKIYWENNTIGVYDGTIRPSGRIEGKGWEQSTPRTKVNWHSVTTMVCADAAAAQAAAPATPKPIRSSGKAKPSAAPLPVTTYDANDPNRKGRGFINGLSNPTPTPSPEAAESASDDTQDQHKKNKKNKKKHHHRDDDENQGND